MNAPAEPPPPMEWNSFMRRPVTYIDLRRLAGCFDDAFGAELCGRLRDASRLHDRLSALISERYALASPVAAEAVDETDRSIALLPVAQLDDLIRRAGAIYWANAIAAVVLAKDVGRLHEQLGEAICAAALANRDLSGPADTFESLDGVDARVTQDGERCLAAWCRSQPESVGARVRLKFAPGRAIDDPPENTIAEIGPSIVRGAMG